MREITNLAELIVGVEYFIEERDIKFIGTLDSISPSSPPRYNFSTRRVLGNGRFGHEDSRSYKFNAFRCVNNEFGYVRIYIPDAEISATIKHLGDEKNLPEDMDKIIYDYAISGGKNNKRGSRSSRSSRSNRRKKTYKYKSHRLKRKSKKRKY